MVRVSSPAKLRPWSELSAKMVMGVVVLGWLFSGTKNEPKPKLLSPDIFRWGRGLPHEGVGAKKFGMPLETREIKLFWRDIPGFCWDIPGRPKSLRKKSLGSIFVPYIFDEMVSVYLRLSTFVRVCDCLRLRLCVGLRLSMFVCISLRWLAFAYAPLCCTPLCVPLQDAQNRSS